MMNLSLGLHEVCMFSSCLYTPAHVWVFLWQTKYIILRLTGNSRLVTVVSVKDYFSRLSLCLPCSWLATCFLANNFWKGLWWWIAGCRGLCVKSHPLGVTTKLPHSRNERLLCYDFSVWYSTHKKSKTHWHFVKSVFLLKFQDLLGEIQYNNNCLESSEDKNHVFVYHQRHRIQSIVNTAGLPHFLSVLCHLVTTVNKNGPTNHWRECKLIAYFHGLSWKTHFLLQVCKGRVLWVGCNLHLLHKMLQILHTRPLSMTDISYSTSISIWFKYLQEIVKYDFQVKIHNKQD